MDPISIEVIVDRHVEEVWAMFIDPKHIVNWNHASDDWECPYAKNDLKLNGRFVFRMTAKDKSASFNFSGTYKNIVPKKSISYVMDDRRKVSVTFQKMPDNETKVTEVFDPERVNPVTMQRTGWQAILNNFKSYVEANSEKKNFETDERTEMWAG